MITLTFAHEMRISDHCASPKLPASSPEHKSRFNTGKQAYSAAHLQHDASP